MANNGSDCVLGDGAMSSLPLPRCFKRSPEKDFEAAVRSLLSLPLLNPDASPQASQHAPDADDVDQLLAYIAQVLRDVMARPEVQQLVAERGLTETDVSALVAYKLEHPYPLYRWLNAHLRGSRRDGGVVESVGPYYTLLYRALEKLPRRTCRAARSVRVGGSAALRHTFDNYATRLEPGKEVSFWGFSSFSTDDRVVNQEQFLGAADEDGIVYLCGSLTAVDMEPFRAPGTSIESELLPVAPTVFTVETALMVRRVLVVTVSQVDRDVAYVVPSMLQSAGFAVTPPTSVLAAVSRRVTKSAAVMEPGATSQPLAMKPSSGSQTHSDKAFIIEALARDPTFSVAWYNLAQALRRGETVMVNGRMCDNVACYAQAVTHDPSSITAWCNLGTALGGGSTTLGQRVVRAHDCYVETLQRNSSIAVAWTGLGVIMKRGESVTISGRTLGKTECIAEALICNTDVAVAAVMWNQLGLALGAGERVNIKGIVVGQRQCYVEALERDSSMAEVWCNLAVALAEDKGVAVVNQREVGVKECFLRTLELNPNLWEGWGGLASVLNVGESLTVGGRRVSAQDCWVEAVQREPANAAMWYRLASLLTEGESVTVNGVAMGRNACLEMLANLRAQQQAGK